MAIKSCTFCEKVESKHVNNLKTKEMWQTSYDQTENREYNSKC